MNVYNKSIYLLMNICMEVIVEKVKVSSMANNKL